ncbi:RagB/SusD family nutrient uptake outer membrane protein [Sphingobacterium gobiense]|uniref:RagB/SusD family nutrient uptake outer membrane protein n=1 Tax=Sphingobacterium gobiense TaxID=1382456 RepID=A0A2S9JRH6_9SPHI|nr:RagB/SusD family nutrient uptake outer membrane protein [Sphingobacterium gobiense]PRD55896.1 RagB/SusD family nutrient uptake outer membrane protein [Sphingobacterium gobiense]
MKLTYIYIAIFTLVTTSCSDILDTAPTDAVVDTEIYKSTENIETVIEGTWRYLNDTYFTYANPGYTAFMRTSDAMGNDVAVTTKYGYRDAYTFNEMINSTAYRVRSLWTLLYKVIDNTNNVIHRVDAAEGSDEDKELLKGQAKALRAFCYLNLASFYQFSYQKDKNALTVPIYTEPTTRETKGKPRASLEDIYRLVLNDLNDASTLLEDYERPNKYRIDTQVVQGLLARTYLNMGLWEKAAEAAENAKEGYDLMTAEAYEQGFNDVGNAEWIWGHVQTSEQNTASYTFHYLDVSSSGSYYFSYMADPYFKDLFDPSDIRYKLFEWDGEPGREGFLRYKKFKFKSNLIGDIVYMRSAEMWLIAAEGYARAGQTTKAIEMLNTLKAARKTPLYSGASGVLLEEILIERRKELWGEGFALSDIIRTQRSVERKAFLNSDGTPIQVEVTTPDGEVKKVNGQGHRVVNFPDGKDFTANSPYYIFAIPDEEIRRNPNLNKD